MNERRDDPKRSGNASEAPPKLAPEDIELRAKPRPVTRINRRMLMLAAGTVALVVFGLALVALDPPNLVDESERRELFRTDNNPMPDGLDALPRRYSDLPPDVPELGPPLPGDLGQPILEAEREFGIGSPETPFRSSPEDDAERAERIRQARLAQQGRESAVFFSVSARRGPSADDSAEPDLHEAAVNSGSGDALLAAGTPASTVVNSEADTGLQDRKLEFASARSTGAIYNPHSLQAPASPHQIMAGTVIAASLVTGLNSDLPGMVIAQVTENVYDTATGEHLLVPQGTRVLGRYDSRVAFGQSRALVVWERLIRPDGSSIVIDNWPATDPAGYAGLSDEVDHHTGRLMRGIGLATLLGVGTELSFGDEEDALGEAIREALQDGASDAGQQIVRLNLDIQPTITVRPGWPLRIIANRDLILRPYHAESVR